MSKVGFRRVQRLVATRLAVALRLVLAEFHQRVVADQSHRQEYSKPSLERLPSQALEQELLVPVQLREQDQPQRFRQMAERWVSGLEEGRLEAGRFQQRILERSQEQR